MAKAKAKDKRTKATLLKALSALESAVDTRDGQIGMLRAGLERVNGEVLRTHEQLAKCEKMMNEEQRKTHRMTIVAEILVALIAGENRPNVLKAKLGEALLQKGHRLADYEKFVRDVVVYGYTQALDNDPVWTDGVGGSDAAARFGRAGATVIAAGIRENLCKVFPQLPGIQPSGVGFVAQSG